MSPEEFYLRMVEVSFNYEDDQEGRHRAMDNIMCDILRQQGYGAGIDVFKNTPKWYA